MGSFDRYKEFQGHFNSDEYYALTNDVDKLKEKLEEARQNLLHFQSKCDHNYVMYATGAYDDTFICEDCGHMIDR